MTQSELVIRDKAVGTWPKVVEIGPEFAELIGPTINITSRDGYAVYIVSREGQAVRLFGNILWPQMSEEQRA